MTNNQYNKKTLCSGVRAKSLSLSYQDSNLDKQSQNLLCYRYTIAHQCAPILENNFQSCKGYFENYFKVCKVGGS